MKFMFWHFMVFISVGFMVFTGVAFAQDCPAEDRTAWYEKNTSESIFSIGCANELEYLRELVNGDTDGKKFVNKTIKLTKNIDLGSIKSWTPIGNPEAKGFKGTLLMLLLTTKVYLVLSLVEGGLKI